LISDKEISKLEKAVESLAQKTDPDKVREVFFVATEGCKLEPIPPEHSAMVETFKGFAADEVEFVVKVADSEEDFQADYLAYKDRLRAAYEAKEAHQADG
jgi:hypothetical protein